MNTERNKKMEEILGSLDGVNRASAPDFFYTRLRARMDRELTTAPRRSFRLRPVYAFAALLVVLLVNAVVILKGNNTTPANTANDTDIMQSIASEYRINSNLTYEINQ